MSLLRGIFSNILQMLKCNAGVNVYLIHVLNNVKLKVRPLKNIVNHMVLIPDHFQPERTITLNLFHHDFASLFVQFTASVDTSFLNIIGFKF